jgi:hypothetical protein
MDVESSSKTFVLDVLLFDVCVELEFVLPIFRELVVLLLVTNKVPLLFEDDMIDDKSDEFVILCMVELFEESMENPYCGETSIMASDAMINDASFILLYSNGF